jgi:hypothetical protein
MEKHRRNTDGEGRSRDQKHAMEQNRMKSFWKSLLEFFEDLGRARAAAELSRAGRYAEARKLYEKDTEVHP